METIQDSMTGGKWSSGEYRYAINSGEKHVTMVNFYKCADDAFRVDERESLANKCAILQVPQMVELVRALADGPTIISYASMANILQQAEAIWAEMQARFEKGQAKLEEEETRRQERFTWEADDVEVED